MQLADYLTESWDYEQKETPVAHAKKLTITQLVEKLNGITTEQALSKLKNNQITINSLAETLTEIGVNYNN